MKRILAKILCVCMSILALVAVSALAEEYSGPTFDLTYEVSNGEVTITDCYYQSTIVEIPRSIDGYPVTRIGVQAFGDCDKLTSITIPSSVTSIGKSAFYDCDKLTSITIPSGVKSIAGKAFYGCGNLTNITIPDSVTSIGKSAFYGCTSLTNITIPYGVTKIDDAAFYGCSNLTSITIPDSVTSIGKDTFFCCSRLTNITMPSGVTSIGASTFYGCDNLTNITIPYGVTSIGAWAFCGCDKLTSITIPRSVTSIGVSAFGLDTFEYFTGTNLKDIYYAGTEEEWGRIVGKNKYDLVNVTMHYNYKMPKINEDNSEVSDNDGDIDKVIFTIGEKNSRVFGVLQENDVAPIIRNNRTMLPARAVAESLGGTVGWDENNKAVTVNGKNKNGEDVSLIINIGSDTAYVNGEAVTLDSPAFIENNRTYTPVRFIAENLGADVLWDGENQRVILER